MMKLADALSQASALHLAHQTVVVGNVYRITMTAENGITPKPGDSSRDKFFIVLGFSPKGEIYGGVIINSNINQKLAYRIGRYHMPISCGKYPFLSHNSFVNCFQLMVTRADHFASWQLLGKIQDEDITLIVETVKDSPGVSPADLKRFGIS